MSRTDRQFVETSFPADPAYLSVARGVAANLAARADFELEAISDLSMAVDEACSALLPLARTDARISCRFALNDGGMTVAVSTVTLDGAVPPAGGLGWLVLQAVADSTSVESVPSEHGPTARISFTRRGHG